MKKALKIFAATVLFIFAAGYLGSTAALAAAFGETNDNGSTQTNSTDRKYVYPATAATSGTVTGGTARVWNGGTVNSNSRLVIYTSTAGGCATTDTLLAQSDQVTINTGTSESAVAYAFSGVNQITVTGGTTYCIGVHFSDPGTGNFNISRANTSAIVRSDGDAYADGPTATCTCTTSSNGPLDIFITYTESAAGGGVSTSTSDAVILFE